MLSTDPKIAEMIPIFKKAQEKIAVIIAQFLY